jgi:hypothetical protein
MAAVNCSEVAIGGMVAAVTALISSTGQCRPKRRCE